MRADIQQVHFFVGRCLTFLVDFGVEFRRHRQSCFGLGGRDVVQSHLVGLERHALPVPADLAEQSMLDGIPFGGPWRIVTDGDAQSVLIAEFLLQIALPDLAARTVGSTRVGEDEKLSGTGIVFPAVAAPPVLDGIDSELGGFSGGAHDEHTGIAADIVDSIRECHPLSVGGKVVVLDLCGFAPPRATAVFEVTDELALLAIDTDDGQIRGLEVATLGCNDHKLPVASGTISTLALEA